MMDKARCRYDDDNDILYVWFGDSEPYDQVDTESAASIFWMYNDDDEYIALFVFDFEKYWSTALDSLALVISDRLSIPEENVQIFLHNALCMTH